MRSAKTITDALQYRCPFFRGVAIVIFLIARIRCVFWQALQMSYGLYRDSTQPHAHRLSVGNCSGRFPVEADASAILIAFAPISLLIKTPLFIHRAY
ncbi:MAG: hypothetical protein Q8R17_02985 [bacterium]|nr:hypothetical protein [bacterium]